ncbi:AsmA family protein [Rhodocytophaga rosea]|uniref:AsmA family protein n=1 Tax=Rhodocytophaga rosea TaxID=2704465 RepID=A0A6C0GNB2_9BACT|nr:AsmA family protein [Rhodocytophaga rosea]QHT69519.1 AsmA family protein [Rhodocytophaga rosea]
MKKAILIILGIFVVLLGAAFILPVVYKDEIKAKIDKEIAKKVDANVYFDADDFSVSLFKHFPNITASMENFGVVGKGVFKSDTLAAIKSFEVTVNIMSVISGDKIQVKAIDLDEPRIHAKVLKDGKANWDIYIADPADTATVADTTSSEFAFGVDNWAINNGYVVYDDRTMPMYARIVDLDHSGSGDFTQDLFDLVTRTHAERVTVSYDGVEYLSDKKIDADMTLSMNLPESKYTFKENTVKLNDFAFGFDGYVAMPDTNINMDITYKTKESTFKSLLSLVPGVYTESFKDVKAEGTIAFDGMAKGTYNAVQMPAFMVNILVKDGMMKYPDLPTAVNNINVDMKVDNKDGVIDNTIIDIKKFHADLGKNPIDGRILVKGLTNYDVDANILAKLNLAELTQMFPIEGLTLKGLYNLDLKAKGVYSEAQKRMPAVNASMSLQNGYVKSKDFLAPLEQMSFSSTVQNQSGQMADTKIHVKDFNMMLEGEPLHANAYIENLDDYTYDVQVKGAADLTKMTKIYPLEGMTLTGKIKADISTKGKMSDVEAERYDQLPTSGTMEISNFTYNSADMPQGMKITHAAMNFTPQYINLTDFSGFAGKSDIAMSGTLSNYIAYLFKENQTIKGNMNFASKQFDVNEWMTEDPNAAATTTEEPLTVFEVPKNVDFTLVSTLGKVLYDNMSMTDMNGTIIVRDGTVRMDKLAFNSLGGNFVTNGTYDTKDIKNPKFDFDLNINNVAVAEAYKTFNTVQALMPLAKNITGNFSTDFKIGGGLGQDMMPLYNSLTGGGLIKLANAVVKDAPILSNLSSFTKLNDLKTIQLKDVLLQAEVKDGRIHFKPFDVASGPYKMNIGGSNGIDGTMDYKVKMDIPAGQLGATVNNALASLTGKPAANAQNIKLDLNIGGTYNQPKIGLAGSSASGTVKEAVTEVVKDKVNAEVDKAKAEAEAKAKAEADRLKTEAEAKAKAEQDRLQKEAEAKKKQLEDEAKKKIEEEKKKLKNKIFGAPKKDTTATGN